MGGDKALVALEGRSLLSRVVTDCREACIEDILVVRSEDADALPGDIEGPVQTVPVPGGREMIDSIRAGISRLPARTEWILHFPVDYAMVGAETVTLLSKQLATGVEIVLPIHDGRPGHPVLLARKVVEEVLAPDVDSLRDVIRRDQSRVHGVPVHNLWVLRDLDTEEDLSAATAFLRGR